MTPLASRLRAISPENRIGPGGVWRRPNLRLSPYLTTARCAPANFGYRIRRRHLEKRSIPIPESNPSPGAGEIHLSLDRQESAWMRSVVQEAGRAGREAHERWIQRGSWGSPTIP